MRCGSDGQTHKSTDDDPLFPLILRFCHAFAQVAELSVSAAAVAECPDPSLRDRMHPYQAASRRKGNPSLKIHTVSQFQARGGGFVSVKDEVSLHRLGIVAKGSPFGPRTGSEYAARTLQKGADFLQKHMESTDMKVLNFAFDAATVAGEHVSPKSLACFFSEKGFYACDRVNMEVAAMQRLRRQFFSDYLGDVFREHC